MTTAYVSVGSNIDPEESILAGLRHLSLILRIEGISTFHRTPPWGAPGTPPFANGVVRVETDLGARALKLEVLRRVEAQTGRVRGPDRYAPRTLDLDLLLYGDLVVQDDVLNLPDPDVLVRPFLAIPLFELTPELVLPGLGLGREAVLAALPAMTMEPLEALTRRLKRELGHEP